MVAPIFQWFADNDMEEYDSITNPLNLGSVDPGVTGTPVEVHLWNNKGGAVDVSDMTDVRITTVTKNGYVSGDSGPSGAEGAYGRYVVENAYIHCKSLTNTDLVGTPIGGAVVKALADIRGSILTAPDVVTGTPGESVNGLMVADTYYYVVSAYDETGETVKGVQSSAVVVGGTNNQVVLEWDEVEGAVGYKVFRTTTSNTYTTPSQVATVIGALTYTDIAESPSNGAPITPATCTYGHKHEVELEPVIPTNAEAGATEFNTRILYKYT